jgi:subtilisin family serine protease/subtilisin-like proprotein convertase family protein
MENGKPAWKIQQKEGEKAYDLSTILVKFKERVTRKQRNDLASLARGKFKDKNEDGIDDRYQHILRGRLALIKLEGAKGQDLATRALLALQNHPFIEYAEHNYLHYIDLTIPNDPDFDELWGLHNDGQSGGTSDADIDAPEAWDITTGSSEVIVGVIDTGVDYTHEDLADNMWTNPGEIVGDGVDNDGNGYVDDIHGWNTITESGDPMDDHWHGTHCSGTIGAVGNNVYNDDKRVVGVGVNWRVKIIAIKFLNSGASGTTGDAIEAINYSLALKNNGVNIRVLSNSWGGGGFSQGLYDAITDAHTAGMLFVAAAGNNNGLDNDTFPHYPSSYPHDNVVAVASTDHNDNLSGFSNIGPTTVDLGAPGSSIFSTLPGNGYGTSSGTSMATPHVAGVAALMLSVNNELSVSELKDNLMNTGDLIPALSGLCVSGKRLNAYNSLPPLWLSADPTSKIVTKGETATYNINIEHVIGFSESVTLNLDTSSTSINANITFQPNPVSPGSSPSMNVDTTETAPGDYIITVIGDSGSISKTTTVMLTVEPEGLINETYSSNDTPKPIPDCKFPEYLPDSPGIITSTINVPDSLTIWNTTCVVEITHTWIGDLILKLKSPAGTEVILRDREGGSADAINEIWTYDLPEFRGENTAGTWTLEVSDNMWADVGTLESWTLRIDGIPDGSVNQAPTVTITEPSEDPYTSYSGDLITFEGTAYDYDYEPPDDISGGIEWNSSIDGDFGTGASVTTHLSAGTHIITARVRDSGGKLGSDSTTVKVYTEPTVEITAPAHGSSFTQGDSVIFTGTATDQVDGDISSSIQWTSSKNGLLGTGASVTTSALSADLNPHTIWAKATNLYSLTGNDSITVTVNESVPQGQVGVNELVTGRYETTGRGKNKVTTFLEIAEFSRGDGVVIRALVKDTSGPIANAVVDIEIAEPETHNLTTGPSDDEGWAEAKWQTKEPNRRGRGGTTPGNYTATVTNVTADGYTWDGIGTSTSFDLLQ